MNALAHYIRMQKIIARQLLKVLSYFTWLANERNASTDHPFTHITEGAD